MKKLSSPHYDHSPLNLQQLQLIKILFHHFFFTSVSMKMCAMIHLILYIKIDYIFSNFFISNFIKLSTVFCFDMKLNKNNFKNQKNQTITSLYFKLLILRTTSKPVSTDVNPNLQLQIFLYG